MPTRQTFERIRVRIQQYIGEHYPLGPDGKRYATGPRNAGELKVLNKFLADSVLPPPGTPLTDEEESRLWYVLHCCWKIRRSGREVLGSFMLNALVDVVASESGMLTVTPEKKLGQTGPDAEVGLRPSAGSNPVAVVIVEIKREGWQVKEAVAQLWQWISEGGTGQARTRHRWALVVTPCEVVIMDLWALYPLMGKLGEVPTFPYKGERHMPGIKMCSGATGKVVSSVGGLVDRGEIIDPALMAMAASRDLLQIRTISSTFVDMYGVLVSSLSGTPFMQVMKARNTRDPREVCACVLRFLRMVHSKRIGR